MSKVVFIFVSMFFFFSVSSNAAIYKGQKMFVKECVSCHNGGQVFIAKKTMREWKKIMDNKGKELADIHLKSEKAKESWEYFNGNNFEKKSKNLEQFLVEYAKDSGNVPACN
jgi:ribosomal protein L4